MKTKADKPAPGQEYLEKKKAKGGARPGAGRPRAEMPTTTVSFRIWEAEVLFVKSLVQEYLKKMRKRKNWPNRPIKHPSEDLLTHGENS